MAAHKYKIGDIVLFKLIDFSSCDFYHALKEYIDSDFHEGLIVDTGYNSDMNSTYIITFKAVIYSTKNKDRVKDYWITMAINQHSIIKVLDTNYVEDLIDYKDDNKIKDMGN